MKRFADSKAGLLVLLIFLMVAGSYISQTVYRAVRADFVASVEQVTSDRDASPDFAALCVDYAAKHGLSSDSCTPFLSQEWFVMTQGDTETIDGWTYNADPEGTFIVTPDGTSIWIPADRRMCPRIVPSGSGNGTAGLCPAWMS